jgi:hypothetical protein
MGGRLGDLRGGLGGPGTRGRLGDLRGGLGGMGGVDSQNFYLPPPSLPSPSMEEGWVGVIITD